MLLYSESVAARAFGTPALIGTFDREEEAVLLRAVEGADSGAHLSRSILDSQDELSELRPKCIFVDGDGAELAETTSWLREHPVLFSTPVIAMVSDLCDSSFVRAYRNGADDVIVRSNVGGVTRRIANLQEFDPSARPPVSRGRVLISHQADEHRRLLGRVLRQASFDVHFAVDSDEIVDAMASDTAPQLVVVSDALLPVSEIDQVRRTANAPRTPFVVVAATASTRIVLDATLERVATISETAPHDHLLFLANDLLTDGCRQLRKSPRYLFDTICSFRPEDVSSPEYGVTYNVSEAGIYVRTLDPPPKNTTLWVGLRPPGTKATVHLRGTLVWVAMPGKGAGATPPGFGLHIEADRSPAHDLKLYRDAYYALAALPNQLAVSWRP
jgi:CheY-like chemotaxis protein